MSRVFATRRRAGRGSPARHHRRRDVPGENAFLKNSIPIIPDIPIRAVETAARTLSQYARTHAHTHTHTHRLERILYAQRRARARARAHVYAAVTFPGPAGHHNRIRLRTAIYSHLSPIVYFPATVVPSYLVLWIVVYIIKRNHTIDLAS